MGTFMRCRIFPFKSSEERFLVFLDLMALEKPRQSECCVASLTRAAATHLGFTKCATGEILDPDGDVIYGGAPTDKAA